jgi:hypothetical protein
MSAAVAGEGRLRNSRGKAHSEHADNAEPNGSSKPILRSHKSFLSFVT